MYIVISRTLVFYMDVMFRNKVIELNYDLYFSDTVTVTSLTVSPSRFRPYASMTVVPLCITPFPVIIHVPDRIFVIVDGNSRVRGEWVVTPISIDPAHLSTILSSRTSNCSPTRSVRLVSTTPLLKSSSALQQQVVIYMVTLVHSFLI